METDPDFVDALTRLPFTPLGPTGWQSCRRAIASHLYGPDVGITGLTLAHGFDSPYPGGSPGLTVGMSAQPTPPPSFLDRAIGHALRRMTTLNPDAEVVDQRQETWDVLGQATGFRLVLLSDGQFQAWAVTGERSVSVGGRDWPTDGLRLVEVDPLMYLSTTSSGR